MYAYILGWNLQLLNYFWFLDTKCFLKVYWLFLTIISLNSHSACLLTFMIQSLWSLLFSLPLLIIISQYASQSFTLEFFSFQHSLTIMTYHTRSLRSTPSAKKNSSGLIIRKCLLWWLMVNKWWTHQVLAIYFPVS